MAELPAWLASTAFTVGSAAVSWSTVVQTTLVIGLAADARQRAKKARKQALDNLQDRSIMVRTSIADRPVILGSARVSGPFFPLGTSGPDGELFHFVVPLGEAIDGCGTIYVGDEAIPYGASFDANGWVKDGKYSSARTDQRFETPVVSGSRKATLSALAATINSVADISSEPGMDSGPTYVMLHLGDPDTDSTAYSVGTENGVTVLTVHSSRVDATLNISYATNIVTSYFRCRFFDGQSGQAADPYLVAQLPDRWTNEHVGHGVSYLSCTMRYHPDIWPSGIPNIAAVVRGARVYDPRNSQTAHTLNPALHARYLLTELFDCSSSEIDDTSVNAAANACDELVAIDSGTSEARYTFDGAIGTSVSPKDMLAAVLDSMMGYAVYSGGKWRVYAGVWREPTLSLTDDDFANDSISVQARQSIRDLVNGARAKYCNDEFIVTDAPAWVSPTYVAEDDDNESIIDLDLQYVRGVYRVQRIEKRFVLQARQAMTVTAAYKMRAYEVTPGDVVELTLTNYGIEKKAFLCVDRQYEPGGMVRLSLREVAEAIDDWNFNEQVTPDPAPNTNLPDVRIVAKPVASYQSHPNMATVLADGTIIPFFRVYWEPMDATVETIEIQWRRADMVTWRVARIDAGELAYDISGVASLETWIVQLRAVNGLGIRSDWSLLVVTVSAGLLTHITPALPGVGSNMLRVSEFDIETTGWTAAVGSIGEPPGTGADRTQIISRQWFGWAKAGATYADLRPIPFNAVVVDAYDYDRGAANRKRTTLFAPYRVIPVADSVWIEAQALVGAYYMSVSIEIIITMADNSFAVYSSAANADGVLDWSNLTDQQYSGDQRLDKFKRIWFIMRVPDAAVRADVRFMGDFPETPAPGDANSYMTLLQPYFGYATPGQTRPSRWAK